MRVSWNFSRTNPSYMLKSALKFHPLWVTTFEYQQQLNFQKKVKSHTSKNLPAQAPQNNNKKRKSHTSNNKKGEPLEKSTSLTPKRKKKKKRRKLTTGGNNRRRKTACSTQKRRRRRKPRLHIITIDPSSLHYKVLGRQYPERTLHCMQKRRGNSKREVPPAVPAVTNAHYEKNEWKLTFATIGYRYSSAILVFKTWLPACAGSP